jgi:hypothetical protein
LKLPGLCKWFIAFLAAVLLAGCSNGGDGGEGNSQPTAASTVMVYMMGSDLESKNALATANIKQMMAATQSKNINVVLLTGGADKANPQDPVTDWRTVRRYVLRNGKLEMLADLGKKSMVESGTLSDFIVWSQKNFPAKNYRLVFWDHGGGYYGFGVDENFRNAGLLTVPKIQAALQSAHAATGIHFDLIGFDACLMATAEVAHALSPYADYLAASEEIEPGSGWDYKAILSSLASTPSMSALQLGRVITDSYLAFQKASGDEARAQGSLSRDDEYVTFSVLDLSKIDAALDAIRSFSSALLSYARQSPDNWVRIAQQRALTSSFAAETTSREGAYDIVDLGTLADRLAAQGVVPEASRLVSSSVSQAVAYRGNGALAATTSGMSIYFPSRRIDSSIITQTYASLDFPQDYKSFLLGYVSYAKLQSPVINVDVSRSSGFVLNSVIQSNFGLKEAALVAAVPADTPNVVRISAMQPLAVTGATHGSLSSNVDQGWVTLNGHLVNLELVNVETRGTDANPTQVAVYGIGAYVNGEYTTLIYEQAQGSNDFTFVGTWDGPEDDEQMVAPRAQNNLKPTDQITLLTYDYDINTQQLVGAEESKESFEAGDMQLVYASVVPGNTSLYLMVGDYAGTMKLSSPLSVRF